MGHRNAGARGITPAPPLLPPPCMREWCTERRPHLGMDWERRANRGNRRGSEDGSGHTPPTSHVSTTPRHPPYKIPAHPTFRVPRMCRPTCRTACTRWHAKGGVHRGLVRGTSAVVLTPPSLCCVTVSPWSRATGVAGWQ